jgi:hypothetical protein
MATLTLASPWETREITLATTTGRVEVPAAVRGLVSVVMAYATAECRYRTTADGLGTSDGAVAPTVGYATIPAGVQTPIPIPPPVDGQAYVIDVWAASGTPRLEIRPYPVTR